MKKSLPSNLSTMIPVAMIGIGLLMLAAYGLSRNFRAKQVSTSLKPETQTETAAAPATPLPSKISSPTVLTPSILPISTPSPTPEQGRVRVREIAAAILPTCYVIPLTATFESTDSVTMMYYWVSDKGGATPIQQLKFNGIEKKTVRYDMPYTHPGFDPSGNPQWIKGSAKLVITKPVALTYAAPYDWGTQPQCLPTPTPSIY